MSLRMGFLASVAVAALSAAGCVHPGGLEGGPNLPPAQMLAHPGPGVDGPGPGVMVYGGPGALDAAGAAQNTSQVVFLGPEGTIVKWDVGGIGVFDSEPLIMPGRQNFAQGAIYRLELTNIPGRPGVELFPTLEIGWATPRTAAYLAHNAIPIQFTEEDLDQVQTGNFVTKVLYLPDPEFQEIALAGVETLVSTRLEPGEDPIAEADRRGAILAIVRLGNKDLKSQGGFDGEDVFPAAHFTDATAGPGAPAPYVGGTHVDAHAGGPHGVPTAGHAPGIPPIHAGGMYPYPPTWGMPMTGTPIGIPGPPHVPLGKPAGLQQHVMHNHTRVHMPGPTQNFRMDVKHRPGYSYPEPVNRVRVHERVQGPASKGYNPFNNRHQRVKGAY